MLFTILVGEDTNQGEGHQPGRRIPVIKEKALPLIHKEVKLQAGYIVDLLKEVISLGILRSLRLLLCAPCG
jgi:hypothetical protein